MYVRHAPRQGLWLETGCVRRISDSDASWVLCMPPSLDFLISMHMHTAYKSKKKKTLIRAESAELRPRTTPDAYLQMRNHFVTVEGKHTRNAAWGAYKQALYISDHKAEEKCIVISVHSLLMHLVACIYT
jgi:hypothetical protein